MRAGWQMIPGIVMVLQLCRRMALLLGMYIKIFWGEISHIYNVLSNIAEKNKTKTYMAKFQQLLKPQWHLYGHPTLSSLGSI